MLMSIIINNYNYGRYLSQSIDSCLSQDYAETEIIVVDDGSEDISSDVLRSYGSPVRSIFKSNGGQGSAMNSGFLSSSGDIVIFLDSDDMLLPHCLTELYRVWRPELSKVHFNLKLIDAHGNWMRENYCSKPLPRGDLRSLILKDANYSTSPNSGNAYSRSFLNRVMPMPEAEWRIAADAYLFNLAPLFGEIGAVDEPLGYYRIHGQNFSSHISDGKFNIEKCGNNIEREMKTETLIATFAEQLGYKVKTGALTNSYSHLQLKFIHDKLAKNFNRRKYGSPLQTFGQMTLRLASFKAGLLMKMFCIHCFMLSVLLANGRLAERLTIFGYRKGAILFAPPNR
jgi:glycosyltransferase involved in cell wall biosynthesis